MISPLAHIHPNAQLGKDIIVDPFAVIEDDVIIGDGTHVMSHAVIMKKAYHWKSMQNFSRRRHWRYSARS